MQAAGISFAGATILLAIIILDRILKMPTVPRVCIIAKAPARLAIICSDGIGAALVVSEHGALAVRVSERPGRNLAALSPPVFQPEFWDLLFLNLLLHLPPFLFVI